MDSALQLLIDGGGLVGLGAGGATLIIMIKSMSVSSDRYREVRDDVQEQLDKERLQHAADREAWATLLTMERAQFRSEREIWHEEKKSLRDEVSALRAQVAELFAIAFAVEPSEEHGDAPGPG